MNKTPQHLIEKCRTLRRQGVPLNKIMEKTNLPKTTVYSYIKDIPKSEKLEQYLIKTKREQILKINRSRKGKSSLNKHPIKFNKWTPELVMLVGHFTFDGEIKNNGCVYNNRSELLIQRVEKLTQLIYKYPPKKIKNNKSEVISISYYNIELSNLIKNKSEELIKYIKSAPREQKRMFLKAFFDDEGCISFYNNTDRKVKGYQHKLETLKLIQKLLLDFDIKSTIENKNREIVIRRKENLKKFQKEINFSKGVYINPTRKNSIWKEKLKKRKILEKAINSYQKLNRTY